jgi:hypothetical protein
MRIQAGEDPGRWLPGPPTQAWTSRVEPNKDRLFIDHLFETLEVWMEKCSHWSGCVGVLTDPTRKPGPLAKRPASTFSTFQEGLSQRETRVKCPHSAKTP